MNLPDRAPAVEKKAEYLGVLMKTKGEGSVIGAKLPLLFLIMLMSSPVMAATYYLDCSVSSSGNGQSWGTAWKGLSNITGLSAGDIVYISGSSTCSTYSASQWNPTNGGVGNPIIYRIGQDSGHNSPVTITLSGAPGMVGTSNAITGVYIDGNYGGNRTITLRGQLGSSGNGTRWNGVRLSYLTMDSTKVEAGILNGLELDHCYIDLPTNSDHFYTASQSQSVGYTLNLIHDNVLRLRQQTGNSGIGDDGFQWLENASVYNNSFIAVLDGSQNIQHQDGIQTCGQYLQIYSNYFENIGNYPVYGDCFGSGAHWRIYNNVSVGATLPLQHFALGFESTGGSTLDDVLISNNTVYNSTGSNLCVSLGGGSPGNKVTNSYIVNNICYRTGVQAIPGTGGSITSSNNYQGTTNIMFVNTGLYPTGDWHLTSGATAAIGQGINPAPSYLTGVYITDKDLTQRILPWDIGAYKSGSTQPPSREPYSDVPLGPS
jgi:hypothetical protein